MTADPQPPRRSVVVVGIGPGDPSLVTVEALETLASLDVLIEFDKGERVAALRDARRAVLERAGGPGPRVISIPDPRRDTARPYDEGVTAWHRERAGVLAQVLIHQVSEHETAGLAVWGDPSLYDSTLRLLEELGHTGSLRLSIRVVPGVSSLHLLTARFGIPLHAVGGSVLITTGRQLRRGLPPGVDDVVVFLDADCSFRALRGQGWQLWWGAMLGMPGESLLAGPVDEIADRVAARRDELRAEHGWVFDVYLLRRAAPRAPCH